MLDPELLRPEKVRPLSRREYDQLVELGAFEDEKLELLRGVLVTMSPQGIPHGDLVAWLTRELTLVLGRDYMVRPQLPFAASEDSEPEPDIMVVPDPKHRRRSHPTEALLLVEVSDSSISKDRRVKSSIYAEAGVPEYWIIDVNADIVEVLTQPSATGYRSSVRLGRDATLRPALLPQVAIDVAALPWP